MVKHLLQKSPWIIQLQIKSSMSNTHKKFNFESLTNI